MALNVEMRWAGGFIAGFNGGPCNLEMQAQNTENIQGAEDVLSFVKRGGFQKSFLNRFECRVK